MKHISSDGAPICPSEMFPIKNWPNYFVSDAGNIYSNKFGRWRRLKPHPDSHGRLEVDLWDGTQRRRHARVHHLVMEAFGINRPKGMECRHLDGNPSNNCLTNLRWGTHTENMADRITHGTHSYGEKHGQAKLTEKDVVAARRMAASGMRHKDIATNLGVCREVIGKAIRGDTWKHIPLE